MNTLPLPVIQILALVRKELAQIGADTRLIRMLVMAPIIQLLVFGAAVNFEVEEVPTAVVDQDQTRASRQHVDALMADGTLTLTAREDTPERALAAMDRGDVAAVVILPEGTGARRMRGEPAPIQVVVDGTDARRSGVAASAIGLLAASETITRLYAAGCAAQRIPASRCSTKRGSSQLSGRCPRFV